MNLRVHAKTDPRLLLMAEVNQPSSQAVPPSVFDHLQYAKTEGEGLGTRLEVSMLVGWLSHSQAMWNGYKAIWIASAYV